MPALHYNYLQQRASDSGRTFSIIFAVIAFFVVAGCLTWGIFLPKIRRNHLHPSPTRFNTRSQSRTSLRSTNHTYRPRFPSHPAILRGFKKHSTPNVRKYDPRTETPFPNHPPTDVGIILPSITPKSGMIDNTENTHNNRGLSTPTRKGRTFHESPSHYNTSTGGQSFETDASHPTNVHKDDGYTLVVPEPVFLRAKLAGKAPTLAKQLNNFPLPRSYSNRHEVAHPRKLFDEIESSHREVVGLTTPTLVQKHSKQISTDGSPTSEFGSVQHTHKPQVCGHSKSSRISNDFQGESMANSNGLKAFWKLMEAQSEGYSGLVRAGTITRPKTPVVAMRNVYDYNQSNITKEDSSTPSESLPTFSTLSSQQLQSVTPPTTSTSSFNLRSLTGPALLTRQDRATEMPTSAEKTRGLTPSSMALPSPSNNGPLSRVLKLRKCDDQSPRLLRKTRPVRLNLNTAKAKAGIIRPPLVSSSSGMPLIEYQRQSIQASSIYSRDTKGFSVTRSPFSPLFPAQSYVESGIIKEEESTSESSSTHLLRLKIDHWDLHTADLELPISPTAKLKRSLSDLGPRSFNHPLSNIQIQRHEVCNSSMKLDQDPFFMDDFENQTHHNSIHDRSQVFEPGRVLKRVIDMEMAASVTDLSTTTRKGD